MTVGEGCCLTEGVYECYQVINCFYLYQDLQYSCIGFEVIFHSNHTHEMCTNIMDLQYLKLFFQRRVDAFP
jgi:hypothetical protein